MLGSKLVRVGFLEGSSKMDCHWFLVGLSKMDLCGVV